MIEQIEKDLKASRQKRLKLLPSDLVKRYRKLEKVIFHMWKLDSVYELQVSLDCFDTVLNSSLTLMELENIIKSDGQKLAKEMTYEKALRYIAKTVTKAKKMNALRDKDDFRSKLRLMISGN